MDLEKYFKEPKSSRQKQYEAVRAFIIEKLPAEIIAQNFGYKVSTIYELVKRAKSGKVLLFPDVPKGPQKRRISEDIYKKICQLRKQSCSVVDIHTLLTGEGTRISQRTIERILYDAGFKKLKRRTNKELGITKKGKIIPERSENLNFDNLEPFDLIDGMLHCSSLCRVGHDHDLRTLRSGIGFFLDRRGNADKVIPQYFGDLGQYTGLVNDRHSNVVPCFDFINRLDNFGCIKRHLRLDGGTQVNALSDVNRISNDHIGSWFRTRTAAI